MNIGNRTENIIVKVSPEEKARIAKLAESCGMNISTYIRFNALKGERIENDR